MTGYQRFYDLHFQSQPLLLANVWNAKSAQIAEQCGFEAIATSSGAIAESLGYKDGEQIPFSELLYMVQRIKATTSIPLSVDFERGYTGDMQVITEHVQKLLDAGVVGVNIEDAQGEEVYLKKLYSIKNYLVKTGQHLFINARTDVFIQKLGSPLETVLNRARLYKEAGADGLFVPAVQDFDTVREIVTATALPLNVVAAGKLASITALADCGVKRISMAVLLYKAAYKQVEKFANGVRATQSFEPLF